MTDWETNSPAVCMSLMSAGTLSPEERRTLSPTASSDDSILVHFPFLSTCAFVFRSPVILSAVCFDFISCTKRTMPLIKSIQAIIMTVVISLLKFDARSTSVINDMTASTKSMTEKGFIKALLRR